MREAAAVRSLRLQLEKAHLQQQRPSTVKLKKKKKNHLKTHDLKTRRKY